MHTEDCDIIIEIANQEHTKHADIISATMAESAVQRGTGISKRSPETLRRYMTEGNAVVALTKGGNWVGFCYLGSWDNGKVVSNSGLIVNPRYRNCGVAKRMKTKLLQLSLNKFPHASIVGFTTSPAVMKINSELGFHPISFLEMARDPKFWEGCKSCVNHDILERTGKKYCLCTAMSYGPGINESIKIDNGLLASEEFH